MNGFRKALCNIAKSDFNTLSGGSNKVFSPRLMRILRVGFSVDQQANTVITEHILQQVVRIGSIGHYPASLRQAYGHLPKPVQVMRTARGKAQLHRNAIGGNHHVHLKPVKVASLRGAVAPVGLSLYHTGAGNADIMANRYRKAINAVGGLQVKRFDDLSHMKEQLAQQLTYAMHPSVKAAFTKHGGHEAGRANKADGLFHITAKVVGCDQHYGDELGIASPSALGFLVVHCFEQIVKKYVHCNGFTNHDQSSCFCVLSTTKLGD
jgi:hypothetical protein